jgi:myo-inositol 2-dehydrogenase/D-chiro-inositol 1-dehydrogenase
VHVAAWQALGADITVYSPAGADALAAQYGLSVAKDIADLLARVDIVDIVTPSPAHKPLALAAIKASKHLVCEKPLGATRADASEIARAAREAGVQAYPAHVVRFFPEYAAIKAEIDAGRIGTPAVLRFTRTGQAPRAGSWFFSEPDGGGIVLDQMIHGLDQARWMAGEVTQVYAVQNPPTVDGVVPGIVTAQVVLTHAGGAISHVQGVWGPPGTTFRTSVEVAGDAGSIGYESPDDGSIRVELPAARNDTNYLPPSTHSESPYLTQLREFVVAFAGGPVPRVSLGDGVAAVALAEAAIASIRSGLAVSLQDGVFDDRPDEPALATEGVEA